MAVRHNCGMDTGPLTKRERASVGIAWAIALLAAILIGVLAGRDRQLAWVSIAMLMLVFVSALLQLLLAKPAGFIHRMSLSLAGAAVILALASLVFVLAGASGFVTAR